MTRRATVRTAVPDPGTAARAVSPDNTDQIATRVDGEDVVTVVTRDDTAGLRSTVDDYVVNLTVAVETIRRVNTRTNTNE